jgi:hypothetical protein
MSEQEGTCQSEIVTLEERRAKQAIQDQHILMVDLYDFED